MARPIRRLYYYHSERCVHQRVEHKEFTVVAAADRVFECAHALAVAVRVGDHQRAPAPFGGGDDGVGFLHGAGNGLFEQYVAAGGETVDGDRSV